MRKLVFLLLAFIAVVTFIRAFDKQDEVGHTDDTRTFLAG
jgi:hypothetical protein